MILNLSTHTYGDPNFLTRWRKVGQVLTSTPYSDEMKKKIQVLVVDQRISIDEPFVAKFPNLKYICTATTGHTHIKVNCDDLGLKLISLKGEREFLTNVRSVSEFVFKLIFKLVRPSDCIGHTLNGKTIGIVGHGRIGHHVEQIAKGFGMEVMTYDTDYGFIQDLFAQSDFVSIHLPEAPALKGFVDQKLIGLMKKSAYLINTARPSLIDENALYAALFEGKIAGAALDFVEPNGVLDGKVRNLIVTPHNAGNTLEDRIRTDEFIVEKLLKEMSQSPDSPQLLSPW